jgi:hypothetical protein
LAECRFFFNIRPASTLKVQIRVLWLTWPTLFSIDEGRYPWFSSVTPHTTVRPHTHSLTAASKNPRRRHRHAPLEGRPAIMSRKHTPLTFQKATVLTQALRCARTPAAFERGVASHLTSWPMTGGIGSSPCRLVSNENVL